MMPKTFLSIYVTKAVPKLYIRMKVLKGGINWRLIGEI